MSSAGSGQLGLPRCVAPAPIEGGSYRVVVSANADGFVWLLSLGTSKAYAKATATLPTSTSTIAPDLFYRGNPLGTYQE